MLNSIWCLSVLLRLDMRWCEIRREPCFLNILWGAPQSKTQYVSTSRAMSPNDLYVVGLPPGCGSNRPFERQMDSAGEVEKKKKGGGGHIYSFEKWDEPTGTCWQTGDPGDFGNSPTGDGETMSVILHDPNTLARKDLRLDASDETRPFGNTGCCFYRWFHDLITTRGFLLW